MYVIYKVSSTNALCLIHLPGHHLHETIVCCLELIGRMLYSDHSRSKSCDESQLLSACKSHSSDLGSQVWISVDELQLKYNTQYLLCLIYLPEFVRMVLCHSCKNDT